MRRTPTVLAVALAALLAAPPALAASGSLSDPDDDTLADVLKLGYANQQRKVVVKMTYDGYRPQVENFYVKWGSAGKYYQLKHSTADGTSFWYYDGSESAGQACAGASVSYDDTTSVAKGVVPRSCLDHAPDKVRFKGIVTEGLTDNDQTKTSPLVARG